MEADAKKKVIVVGAGAAGMMAAYVAAQRGMQVLLLEKMDAYCQQECGKTLAEYREALIVEEQETALEAPSM